MQKAKMAHLNLKSLKLIPIAVFIVTTVVYSLNLPADYRKDFRLSSHRELLTSGDAAPNTFLPYLILKYKTLDFKPISFYMRRFDGGERKPYFFIQRGESRFSAYPILTGIMALPIYAIPVLLNKIPDLKYYENMLKILVLGRVAAVFMTSLTVTIFYLCLQELKKSRETEQSSEKIGNQGIYMDLLVTALLAFGTSLWTINSRSLWTHTSSTLLITLALYALVRSVNTSKLNPLSGLFLGLSVVARPTNIIGTLILTVFVLSKFRNSKKRLVAFGLLALTCAGLLLAQNYLVYGNPFTSGYEQRNDIKWSTPLTEGLTGIFFAPSRSIFILTPVFVLVPIFLIKLYTKRSQTEPLSPLYKYLGLSVIATILMYSKWWAWHGADGFGYRMLTELTPFMAIFVYEEASRLKKWTRSLLAVGVIYSILIQFNGVYYNKSRCESSDNWTTECVAPRYLKRLTTP